MVIAAFGVSRPSSATPTANSGVPAFSHIFVVVMENRSFNEAMSTAGVAALANRWALATNYYGVSHPSLPNYLAMVAGSTFQVASDCVTCYVNASNLFVQLNATHHSYDAYFEGVSTSCFLAPWGGSNYASKHNPFRYFNNVRNSPSICRHLRPYTELAATLQRPAALVPQFVWVTPNLCSDGHDCSSDIAAKWLSTFVRSVTASAAWKNGGVLFVTWDEGEGDDAGVNANRQIVGVGGGGHVVTLVIAPHVAPGARIGAPLNHYSLLATVEDSLGLGRLGAARTANSFAPLFK